MIILFFFFVGNLIRLNYNCIFKLCLKMSNKSCILGNYNSFSKYYYKLYLMRYMGCDNIDRTFSVLPTGRFFVYIVTGYYTSWNLADIIHTPVTRLGVVRLCSKNFYILKFIFVIFKKLHTFIVVSAFQNCISSLEIFKVTTNHLPLLV